MYLFWLLSETTNKQIHEVWFLSESAYQKYFSKIWAFYAAIYEIQKLHTLVYILASLRNNKQTKPQGIILSRIHLPCLKSGVCKIQTCNFYIYYGFCWKQQANKFMGYYSYQNLLTKILTPVVRLFYNHSCGTTIWQELQNLIVKFLLLQ